MDILHRADRTVVDITVEDPSDNFVRLRDFVDTRNCLELEAFSVDKIVKVSESFGRLRKYVGIQDLFWIVFYSSPAIFCPGIL